MPTHGFLITMTPRPIYKWKTFWLGVLIIASLCWASVRSYHYADFLEWRSSPAISNGVLSNGSGSIRLGLNRPDVGGDPFTYYANDISPFFSQFHLPKAFEYRRHSHFEDEMGGPTTAAEVAHWLILLLFLIPWLTLLIWRSRHIRSLTKPQPSP